MARVAYVNGSYVPLSSKSIDIEDRGYQFADGIYEVIKAIDGKPRDLERHLARLQRSLKEIRLPMPISNAALRLVIAQLLKRNRLRRAIVYIQVSRGTAPRSHTFPKNCRPNLVMTVRNAPFPTDDEWFDGVSIISLPDERWSRCDIKSISLLPNVLSKQLANEAGSREAWLLDQNGFVTEGCSSNAYIVDSDGKLITHPKNQEILGGITRSVLLELAEKHGLVLEKRPFSIEEARRAREAFITSTTSLVLPVTSVDDKVIGNGHPGTITRELQNIYMTFEQIDGVFSNPSHRASAYK